MATTAAANHTVPIEQLLQSKHVSIVTKVWFDLSQTTYLVPASLYRDRYRPVVKSKIEFSALENIACFVPSKLSPQIANHCDRDTAFSVWSRGHQEIRVTERD